jgi:hypothetical protein
VTLKVSAVPADDPVMDTEPKSFEEQFATFNGHGGYRLETPPAPALVEQPPAPLAVVPEEVAPAFAPAPETFVPAAQPVEDIQTESLLADLDKATESLTMFRDEIGRLVQLQQTTATELENTRRELATLASQPQECDDCHRLEGELSRQREIVSHVRSKLGEVFATLGDQ